MYTDITELIGKTFHIIEATEDKIRFIGNETYEMYHEQDCCESVYIEDICGNIKELQGSSIMTAYESSHHSDEVESETWTFYHIATRNTTVTIRWYGSSNGYYSESVEIHKVGV